VKAGVLFAMGKLSQYKAAGKSGSGRKKNSKKKTTNFFPVYFFPAAAAFFLPLKMR
jgi:hypothetical protein